MKKAHKQRCPSWVKHLTGILIFLLIWELVVRVGIFSSQQLSPPSQVIETFFTKLTDPRPDGATLGEHFIASFSVTLGGFLLACLIGIPAGLAMGYYRPAYLLINPIFELVRPIPPIAWIPLIIMWFGVGETAKIAICFIGCFVPLVVNTLFGVSSLDPTYLKAARVLGAGRRALLLEIVLPGIFPSILAGMKVALSSGWVCVIAAEMIAAREGLGYLIIRSMETGNMLNILVALIFIGSISALLSALFSKMEKVVCPW